MNVDTVTLKHFNIDGEPLDEDHPREFMRTPGMIFTSSTPANIY